MDNGYPMTEMKKNKAEECDTENENHALVTLSRPVLMKSLQEDTNEQNNLKFLKYKASAHVKQCCRLKTWLHKILSLFPMLTWLPAYEWKSDFLPDLLAGLTVGIMSIPQGMAYARLAGMPPIYGLYTNIIPTFVYFLMGTARHAAIGPATVLSLILGSIRYKHIPCEDCWMLPVNSTNYTFDDPGLTPIQIGSAAAFLVGVFLIIMGLFRLSFISDFLPDQLVSGFTVACAVQVLAGQLRPATGIQFPHRDEIGNVILRFIDLFAMIKQTNVAAFLIFAVCFVFLIISKHVINPRFQAKLKIPFPGECIVMIVSTIISHFCHFNRNYQVRTVKYIQPGFPAPVLPKFSMMHTLIIDCLVLAIVTYTYSISLAKLYAKRNGYKIQTAQEFYSYGAMNFVGSFFQCFNSGQSVARSMVYEMAGAKSQLCGMIGTMVVICTILFIAPFLQALPNASLAAIIVTAAVEMFRNLKELPVLFRKSKYDFAIYTVSLVSVIVLDVTYGLLVSVTFGMLTVIMRSQRSKVKTADEESFLLYCSHEYDNIPKDLSHITPQDEIWRKMRIIRIPSPLFYLNAEKIKNHILECAKTGQCKLSGFDSDKETSCTSNDWDHTMKKKGSLAPRIVILDMTSVSFMDLMGIHVLKEIKEQFMRCHVSLYLCGCTEPVETMLRNSEAVQAVCDELFPSVLDAITYSRHHLENEKC